MIVTLSTILISILSIGGIFINNTLTKVIEEQSTSIEQADVRVSAVPTHKLLKGKTDGIKLNLQGWEVTDNVRLELLQLQTDKVQFNLPKLRNLSQQNKKRNWQEVLESPLNMGWRIILSEEDLNNLFLSSQVQSIIQEISEDNSQVQIINLSCNLQPNNRLVLESKMKLAFRGEEEVNVRLEFGLDLTKGHQFQIKDIEGTLNDRKLSSKLLQGFADNINTKLSLRALEKLGITLRLLQFDINEDKVALAGFIHISHQNP